MNNFITWMNENREWLFSGIGITVITLTFAGVRRLFRKKKAEENSKAVIKQNNYGMKNIQAGIQKNSYTKEEDDE